jgi:hypothetical protein
VTLEVEDALAVEREMIDIVFWYWGT